MDFTLDEILIATGAQVLKNETGEQSFCFSTDTRTIKAGEIYLPLKGESFDGEDFIDTALENGAIGYFTTDKETIFKKAQLILKIDNALEAYLKLAKFYRDNISPVIIAITGSSGKTTTKEMAYSVFSKAFDTHKSQLNFNNEIGLCKTILSMSEDCEVLILEMGMRGLGEIELLSKYSAPDITIVANVGSAHIGRLGSSENIAKAKCEITKFQNKNGIFIAHDNELIKNAVKFKGEKTFFSLNDVKVLDKKAGYSKFEYKGEVYELNVEGDYNIQNALAVIEAALYLTVEPDIIKAGLKSYQPIEKRWEVQDIKGFKIINDSYNANPDSMQAVLKTCLDIYENPLFVLGDMGELGEEAISYHKKIGEFLHQNNDKSFDLLSVGDLSKEFGAAPQKHFTTTQACADYILENIQVGTTIILKASRSMKFEDIIERIKL